MAGIDPISVVLFILGAIVGSFLNVCIVRLPHEQSVVTPRSHCVHCKKTIAWYDNIPFFSYLVLRGRCRSCGQKISPRYFLVELVTALTFFGFYQYYGLQIILLPYLVMVCGFIVATFVDFEHRIIPDEVSVGGVLAGLVFSLLIPQMHEVAALDRAPMLVHLHSLGLSLLGVLVGGGCTYVMGALGNNMLRILRRIGIFCRRSPRWRARFKRYRGMRESIGGGDIKLLAMVGAFMGWKMAMLTFFFAPFFGAVYGLIEVLRKKGSVIAYGPFLILGALVSLFWGDEIIRWILWVYGLY